MSLDEEKHKQVSSLIKKATTDLDELYTKIKKSKKILKYKGDGNLLMEIYANILSNFSLLQILEFSGKAKMINNDSGLELDRESRLQLCVFLFKSKFDYIFQQHLELLRAENNA